MVSWGLDDAFYAMSEYGDVAYRLGDKSRDDWSIWAETVEEWKSEEGFRWSEVAVSYIIFLLFTDGSSLPRTRPSRHGLISVTNKFSPFQEAILFTRTLEQDSSCLTRILSPIATHPAPESLLLTTTNPLHLMSLDAIPASLKEVHAHKN